MLAVNKLDLDDVSVLQDEIREAFASELDGGEMYFISAATHEGLQRLLDGVLRMLQEAPEPVFSSSYTCQRGRPAGAAT